MMDGVALLPLCILSAVDFSPHEFVVIRGGDCKMKRDLLKSSVRMLYMIHSMLSHLKSRIKSGVTIYLPLIGSSPSPAPKLDS